MTNKHKKPIALLINVPIYREQLIVSLHQDDKEFLKTIKQYFKLDPDDEESFLKDNYGAKCFYHAHHSLGIIRVKQKVDFNLFCGFVAHEVAHFVFMCLSAKGMSLSEDSEEAYTYLIEYITAEIFKHV